MDSLYFLAAGCLLREYDSFSAITYSWLGIGRIQEVIMNVSQWEVFALTEGVVEHNVSYRTNNDWEDVSAPAPNLKGRASRFVLTALPICRPADLLCEFQLDIERVLFFRPLLQGRGLNGTWKVSRTALTAPPSHFKHSHSRPKHKCLNTGLKNRQIFLIFQKLSSLREFK